MVRNVPCLSKERPLVGDLWEEIVRARPCTLGCIYDNANNARFSLVKESPAHLGLLSSSELAAVVKR
jgi:hypothetical protein